MLEMDPFAPRESKFWRLINQRRVRSRPWCWPLVKLGDREPIVLAEHINGTRRGVDLGYESRPYDDELHVPVFAVQSGEVTYCAETLAGFSISLRHVGTEWLTYYGHLSTVFLADTETARHRTEWVRAGDVIGYAARSPIHVRFELVKWTEDKRFVAFDPKPEMKTWKPNTEPTTFLIKKAA